MRLQSAEHFNALWQETQQILENDPRNQQIVAELKRLRKVGKEIFGSWNTFVEVIDIHGKRLVKQPYQPKTTYPTVKPEDFGKDLRTLSKDGITLEMQQCAIERTIARGGMISISGGYHFVGLDGSCTFPVTISRHSLSQHRGNQCNLIVRFNHDTTKIEYGLDNQAFTDSYEQYLSSIRQECADRSRPALCNHRVGLESLFRK